MAFPVVLSPRGTPVTHAENAIKAVVAANGLGVPVMVVHEGGYPLNIDAGPAPGGQVPTNVSPPTVSTAATLVNIEEDAKPGTWQSDTDISFTYQWQVSDDGEVWTDIEGATGDVYTPVFADRMKYLRAGVVATNDTGASGVVYSEASGQIGPYDFQFFPGVYGAPSGDTGFSKGRMGNLHGRQPIPGHDLEALYSRAEGYGNIAFSGDCMSVISNLDLVLDPAPSVWGEQSAWQLSGGETQCIVPSASPFDLSNPCNVTWKEKGTTSIEWGWQSISMTAGAEQGQWVGYSTGAATLPQPAFGSIDREPTTITTLLGFYDDTNSGVFLAVFQGDYATSLDGLQVSLGGFVMTEFEVEVISGNTWVRFTGIPGDMTDGSLYEVLFGWNL